MKCLKCKAKIDDGDVADYAADELGMALLSEDDLLELDVPADLCKLLWARGHITASDNRTYEDAVKILEEILS